MLRLLRLLVVFFTRLFRSRRDLLLENLALRQQLGVLKQKHPPPRFATCASPKFHPTEKLNRSPDVLTVKSWLPPHSCKLKSDENTGGRNFGEGQVQVQSLNLRSRQAYDGGKIHHSHQIWPARAVEVRRSANCRGKSHGARGSRCSMAFSYQPAADSTSARTE